MNTDLFLPSIVNFIQIISQRNSLVNVTAIPVQGQTEVNDVNMEH